MTAVWKPDFNVGFVAGQSDQAIAGLDHQQSIASGVNLAAPV